MHNRFRRACYALAGGVAVTATLSLTAAGAASASTSGIRHVTPDATNVCGTMCNDLFNLAHGPNRIPRTGGHYDSRIWLGRAHNYWPSEDFIATKVGTLGQFISSGLISSHSYVALNYPHFYPVFEEEFAPYSVTTDLCAAARYVRWGAPVVLQRCGDSARSLWVGDLSNKVADSRSILGFDLPWVNGADRAFSHALSLTARFRRMFLAPLSKNGGAVNDSQEWGIKIGPAI